MEKLISMREFVMQMRENKNADNITRFWKCESYAKFLSQPLTLGMFVPCDEDGNVLEEPDHLKYKFEKYPNELHFISESHKQRYSDAYDKYESAKSKVLFDGFRLLKSYPERNLYFLTRISAKFAKHELSIGFAYKKGQIIESLIRDKIFLTPTACKKIGI